MRSIIAAAAIALSATLPAASHEHKHADGATQVYDPWCCNMMDCTPMSRATQVNGKWVYTNGHGNSAAVEAGYTKFFASKDGLTHACVWREGADGPWRLRCLYIPGGN